MSNAPLMPMATAVWLVDNTSLTFKQIANFCKLHEVEIQGIADGEVAKGIVGYNPIISGQLTKEEINSYEWEREDCDIREKCRQVCMCGSFFAVTEKDSVKKWT